MPPASSRLRTWFPQLSGLARAQEWWEYKLAPILATAYATTLVTAAPLGRLPTGLLFLLASLIVGATYVSLLNDFTDRAEDQAAGKPNRLAAASPGLVRALFSLCLGSGLLFGWYAARLSSLAALLYLGAWVAYTLYSLPPFRWKTRGALGLLADAAGAHLFPQLFTVALVSAWLGRAVPLPWLLLVGVWSLACGGRNIIWHQLHDEANDVRTQTATFVVRWGARWARHLAERILFPVEVVAFAGLLWLGQAPLAWLALLVYGGLVWFRLRQWGIVPVVAAPRAKYQLWLNEYYEGLYPLAMLLTAAWPLRAVGAGLLIVHGLLFSQRLRQTALTLWAGALTLGARLRRVWRLR
ncbi:UbiA family prenyltransferase [Hymenobacter sp. BT18]|uniref:UbiA family prenyltransferase n=1 Tax=Hymenobacter sp. BT18 TaxID=2835648 RepID=UPI00143EDD85|nr:UbiA family prenyltransferase [Hymenobacter sp. BT18]QIX60260.1 UbiA family prenyltransferase [Hymenobacter sp. BT18]